MVLYMGIVQSLFFVLCLSLGANAWAKTLYVNNTGSPVCSNTTTYAANDQAHPWCTIMRASRGAETYGAATATGAARAGDLVLITAGIYWENGNPDNHRFSVALNPVNSGTVGQAITFRGVGNVYIRMNAGFRGGTIGCSAANYIIWDNFKIEDHYQGSTSDTGPVVFSGGATHCQLVNSDIRGHNGSYFHGYPTYVANYRGISIEPANFITIRNNFIHDFPGGQNECGIMAYDSNDNLIENNTIYNNGCGIFIKGVHAGSTQARNVIRRNLIYNNNHSSIRVLGSQDGHVYQNVVASANSVGLWAGFGTSERSRFVNNTVYSTVTAMVAQGSELIDVRFLNNIFSNTTGQVLDDWSVTSPRVQDVRWDRNVYFTFPRFYNNQNNSASNMTFEQFRAAGYEANGLNSDPMFVDAANRNFRLQPSSPARNVGVDVLDLNGNGSTTDVIPAGAYITGTEIIGAVTGAQPPPTSLSPPRNVNVR
jgi:parallel beta-helix repeat protein